MYDYQKDEEQLSSEDNIGTFQGGENISSGFKLKRESLPQWAVGWAKNRFNLDAKNVKFYVMDEQEAYDSLALASGDSIFVTSDHENDEEVIKHELTHIYQQAIGTATEGNAGDTSLENEAVQVSKEGETSLAKTQVQGNGYILPREKTNVVQSLGTLAIAGLVAIASVATVAGAIGGVCWLVKQIRYERISRESGLRLKTVKKVCNIFKWAYEDVYEVINLCTTVNKKHIKEDQLRQDSKALISIKRFSENTTGKQWLNTYNRMLEEGFKGFKAEEKILSNYFKIHTEIFSEEQGKGENIKTEENLYEGTKELNKFFTYIILHNLTVGFTNRRITDVENDIKFFFGCDLGQVSRDQIGKYQSLYGKKGMLTQRRIEDIQGDIKAFFGSDLASISENQFKRYLKIYDISEKFTQNQVGDIQDTIKAFFGSDLASISENQFKRYLEIYGIIGQFTQGKVEEIQGDIKVFFGSNLASMPENQFERYLTIYRARKRFTPRSAKDIQGDIEVLFEGNLASISKNQFRMYLTIYNISKGFQIKTPRKFKEIVEYISGYKFRYAIFNIGWSDLIINTHWFSRITMENFVMLRNQLATIFGIDINNAGEWIMLINEIIDNLLEKMDYFQHTRILIFTERLANLKRIGYYRRKGIGDELMKSALHLKEVFNICIQSLNGFPNLRGPEVAIAFAANETLSGLLRSSSRLDESLSRCNRSFSKLSYKISDLNNAVRKQTIDLRQARQTTRQMQQTTQQMQQTIQYLKQQLEQKNTTK